MRKVKMFVLFGLLAALLIFTTVVSADAGGIGAEVLEGLQCGMFTPWGQLVTGDSHLVITPSGNISLTCNFELPESWPVEAYRETGFWCGVLWNVTYDSFFVVSPDDGTAMLHCKLKP